MANELALRIENRIVRSDSCGTVEITTYSDRKPTKDELAAQIQRLQYSFSNVNDGFVSEMALAFYELGYTLKQVSDMITATIRTKKYRTISISDVLSAPNGIIKLYPWKNFANKPTEELYAEYFKVCKVYGSIMWAKKEDMAALSEPQKEILRDAYRRSFLTPNVSK